MMSKVLITIIAKAQELSNVWKHHSKYRVRIAPRWSMITLSTVMDLYSWT